MYAWNKFLCVYICVRMCAPMHACRGRRRTLGILLCHFPLYSLETVPLNLEPGYQLASPSYPPVSITTNTALLHCSHAQHFAKIWVLEIQTQILLNVQEGAHIHWAISPAPETFKLCAEGGLRGRSMSTVGGCAAGSWRKYILGKWIHKVCRNPATVNAEGKGKTQQSILKVPMF